MKRILVTMLLVGALCFGMVACKSGDSGKPADKPADAKAVPCTKCKCANWTDDNKDGKCDTKVDGKACDHAMADHKAP
ncbi:hypothetical protein HY251_05135 [bacterium]|nr:hypothetical protein [bacterium]